MRLFDLGAEAALADMKSYANREIDKFKDERYSGITGGARWLADLFRPVPEGIKVILGQARTRFASKMDALAVRISAMVDGRLAEAKAEVNKGQAAIKTYVDGLPKDLQAVGREAQQAMTERFEELRNGIDAKKNDLAQKLAQKYKEAHDKADSALKKLEEENAGALKKLADAIGEVIKILSEFKDKLMAVLRKGLETIKLILADPIGFLGNLLAAVKQGFNQFVGNIWTHLKKGFMQWLFGSLAEAGIQVPSDLNVWSILKLVLDVLGLTYAWMRSEAVKLMGERNVMLLEKLVEYITITIKGGPQALWDKLKEDLSNLKAMVIDAIQNWLIETIVKQAVTKILSMFNPAGAIVQAILAIYNVVMWVIENASRIVALIEAVVNSVHAIATGAIGGAAAWIEKALASLIPIVIGFLARLIGLGGLSAKIREFITKVQAKVRGAVLGWLKKAWAYVKKLFGGGKGKPDERTEAQKKADLDKGVNEATQFLKDPKLSSRAVTKKLAAIKRTYEMTELSLVVVSTEGIKEKVHVHGVINPEKDSPDADKITGMEPITVDFKMKKDLDEDEFHRQLAESQAVLDDMTVQTWIANRESFYQRKAERKKKGFKQPEGRDPAGTAAQAKAKEKALLAEAAALANADPKLSLDEAKAKAAENLKNKVATHKLDQVAGGSGTELSEKLGGAREDFSIGAGWVSRSKKLFEKVKDLPDDVKKEKMKIVITVNGGPLKK
jgi:hypothetical protein